MSPSNRLKAKYQGRRLTASARTATAPLVRPAPPWGNLPVARLPVARPLDPDEVLPATPRPAVDPTADRRKQVMRRANEAVAKAMARGFDRKKWAPSRFEDSCFPEKAEWAVPEFVPGEVPWPRAALDKQEAGFQFGYSVLRRSPRGMTRDLPARRQFPRPTAAEVDLSLPYFLTPWFARALARITLALQDPRTPRDVKRGLAKHLRDIVRGDHLLEAARPWRLPQSERPRVSPEARAAFPDLYRSLLRLCKSSNPISAEDVVEALHRHLPDGHAEVDDTRRKTLDGVLKKSITSHIKAKRILMGLFDISERYTRKLTYGW
jgi:hypothetical protein